VNNRPEPFFFDSTLPDTGANLTQRLDDYLDHLCAPLVGTVPHAARNDFRTESRAHLEALAAEYRELGMTPHEALETAFREFGEPWQLGHAFQREWARSSPIRMRWTQTPTACAFAWFGAATVLNLELFERVTLLNLQEPKAHYWSTVVGLSPLIAGLLTGLTQPRPDGRAVLRVQGALLLFTLLLSLTLLPHGDLLILAACQLLWWLPAGYATTVTVATMAQRLRRPRFPSTQSTRRPAL
jgi:hypothetical protein